MFDPQTILPGEVIVRQLNPKISSDPPGWFHDVGQPPVPAGYFTPSEKDTTGHSVLWASQRHVCYLSHRANRPGVSFKLACMNHAMLQHEGIRLTFEPDDLDREFDTHAHAVLGEHSYPADKGELGVTDESHRQARSRARELRDLIRGRACFAVIGPFEPPTPDTPVTPDAQSYQALQNALAAA